ncbi:MAG: hypothetical protein LBV44_04030 [Methylobacillus sp.]|jgi:hypothetical protein|nr:hypothetical protein [Methylobacillus sp.]
MKRPLSLILIACFLIVAGLLALGGEALFWLVWAKSGELTRRHYGWIFLMPVWMILAFNTIATAVTIVAGVTMLAGREWGRKIYVAAIVPMFALSIGNVADISSVLALFPPVSNALYALSLPPAQQWLSLYAPTSVALIVAAMISCLFIYLLYRPDVTEYFGRPRTSNRPISLTIIAWGIIAQAALGIITMLIIMTVYLFFPEIISLEGQIKWETSWMLLSVGIKIAMIAIGIAILKGRAWSRHACSGIFVLALAIQIISITRFITTAVTQAGNTEMLLAVFLPRVAPLFFDLPLFALLIWLLYRRPASDYFRQAR